MQRRALLAVLTTLILPAPGVAQAGSSQSQTTEPVTVRQMLAEANAVVQTLTAADAMPLLGRDDVVFVDLRTDSERARLGWIPGSVHVPRGMLEFTIDSRQPQAQQIFHTGRRIVFYCAGGGRSALAAQTAMIMGLKNVAHVGGGLRAWTAAGGPVTSR